MNIFNFRLKTEDSLIVVGCQINFDNFALCAYDFMRSNILTDFDGVLGLDFFKSRDLLISFKRYEIIVE